MDLASIRGDSLVSRQEADRRRRSVQRSQAFLDSVPSNYVALPNTDVRARLIPACKPKLDSWLDYPTQSAILYGGIGLGKSVMAVWMCQQMLLGAVPSAAWISWTTMLHDFSWNMSDDPVAALTEPEILVIDDVGAESIETTKAQAKLLFELIEHRTNESAKITIYTTNVSLAAGPGSFPSIVGERSWDRIKRSLTALEFRGESLRKVYRD